MSTRSHPAFAKCSQNHSISAQDAVLPRSRRHRFRRTRPRHRCRVHLVLALLLVASPALPAPAPQWRWPVDPPRVIARAYLAPPTPYGSGHRGIDIESVSSAVYAPADGVVHFAGVVVDRPVLSLRMPGDVLASFEPVASTLVEGATVHRGDVIGTLAPGHCAVVTCLHFGVRVGGEYVSPLLFLGGLPRSILLPTRAAASAASPRATTRPARGRRSARGRLRASCRHPPR